MSVTVILQNTLIPKVEGIGAALVEVPMQAPEGMGKELQFGRLRFTVGDQEYVVSVSLYRVEEDEDE